MTSRNKTVPLAIAFFTLSGCERCEDGCRNQPDDSVIVDDTQPHSDSGGRDNDGDGYTISEGDCDDNDDTVYPTAIEICDGKDTNCDEIDDDTQGGLLFVSPNGTQTILSDGTETSPSTITLTESGTLNVCGTVYASIAIDNIDISMLGLTEDATLSAANMYTVIVIRNSAAVHMNNIAIRDGLSNICQFAKGSGDTKASGGGICCEDSSLNLENIVIDSNAADYAGGGIYTDSCDLTLLNSTITHNFATEYGAGLLVIDGSASLDGSLVNGNVSLAVGGGGGFLRRRDDARAGESYYISESSFIENEAASLGGGIFLSGPLVLECDGGNDIIAGIFDNVANSGGGLWFNADGPILKSVLCDWGTGEQNNSSVYGGPDIGSEEMMPDAPDFGDDETFDCGFYSCPSTL